jgi:very-short-patch-repair endonuclease
MDPQTDHSRRVWTLARDQHGVVSRRQLLEIGFGPDAIKHRVARGRLHPVRRGVYAVGRSQLTREGRWSAALLCCGGGAALSHESAAELWAVRPRSPAAIEISVPAQRRPRALGVLVHRRSQLTVVRVLALPVTAIVDTLVDLAVRLQPGELERAVNEADRLDLIDPESLRAALGEMRGRHGVRPLCSILDRRTFTLTDSDLERRFLPIARAAGLPKPETGRRLNGFKVDFVWPELGLVVETDGLRYHRTPAQQSRDRLRDQAHLAAGLTPVRFTHGQVRFDPAYVQRTLGAIAQRLSTGGYGGAGARRGATQ